MAFLETFYRRALPGLLALPLLIMGSCVSDPVEEAQSSFSKDGLVLWLDASDPDNFKCEVNGAVILWKDISGKGNDVAISDESSRPKVVDKAINKLDAVRFNGAQFLKLQNAIRERKGELAVFVVAQRLRSQASGDKWQRLVSSWDGKTSNDNKKPSFCLTAPKDGSPGEFGPTVFDLFEDDAALGSLAIGANSATSGDKFKGDIAEILVFDRGFVAEDPVQLVLKYLSLKWNAKIARSAEGWTRLGPLGETPLRKSEALPLSDQDNKAGWTRFEPLWDEFEGAKLDEAKWWPCNPNWKGRQPALFRESNVEVRDGKLNLTMRSESVEDAPEGYHSFTSAAVQSKTRVKYGYLEIKAKPMNSAGSSAFWLYYSDDREWTEIDIFEIGGGAPGFERKYNMNLHVFRTPEEKRHWNKGGIWSAPWNLASDWHVYGLEWDETNVIYYVDGVPVRRVFNSNWHQPLTLDFDSETMPAWFGLPDPKALPSTFSVEYVRAWKKPGQDASSLPGFPAPEKSFAK